LYAETAKPTQTRPSNFVATTVSAGTCTRDMQQLAELTDRAVFLYGCGFKYQLYRFQLDFTEARNIYTTGIYFLFTFIQ
jgi:hypothetical protein